MGIFSVQIKNKGTNEILGSWNHCTIEKVCSLHSLSMRLRAGGENVQMIVKGNRVITTRL